MGSTMWKMNWLSSSWRTQIFFALAGVIFVLCQFLVSTPPKLDPVADSGADRSAGDGSFQQPAIYFDSTERSTDGLNQASED